jgi:hypothetical protein
LNTLIENYDRPVEMPEVFVDDNGIINVDYGSDIVTTAHVVWAVNEHRKIDQTKKMPVMIFVEMATNVEGDMSEIGQTDWVNGVTAALAIVTTTKIANVIGNIFIKFQKNPYPTKLFHDQNTARRWLQQFKG